MTPSDLLSLRPGDVITDGKDQVRVLAVEGDHICVDTCWYEPVVRDYIYDVSARLWEMAQAPRVKKGQPGYKVWLKREEDRKRWMKGG